MTFAEFHNGLRILLNIDRDELEAAGVIQHGDRRAWGEFRTDPFRWFIRASDERADKLWTLMKERM